MSRKQNSLMKFSRNERLAQLSEQEIVIERKKREIQAKLEAQKQKETEDALKKLESIKNKPEFLTKPAWERNEHKTRLAKEKSDEQEKKESLKNAFSNDGSFLDQFKKLSRTGLNYNFTNQSSLMGEIQVYFGEKKDNKSLSFQQKEPESQKEDRSHNWIDISSSSSDMAQLDSDTKIHLPPPGIVQLIPQHAVQPISMIPPPSDQIPNLQSVVNSVSQFTKNESQLKAESFSSKYKNTPQPVPSVQILDKQSSENNQFKPFNQQSMVINDFNISPSVSVTSQNISPFSSTKIQNIPPTCSSFKNNELPNFRTESISLTLKSNPVKKLESIPNPLDNDQNPESDETEFDFSQKMDKTSKSAELGSSGQKSNPTDEETTRISSALPDNHEENEEKGDGCLKEEIHSLAKMVARCGDNFEQSLRKQNENNPSLRFLINPNSKEYLLYRKLVLKYRRSLDNTTREDTKPKQNFSFFRDSKFETFSLGSSAGGRNESPDLGPANKPEEAETFSKKKYADGYQADSEKEIPYCQTLGTDSTSKDSFSLFSKQSSQTEVTRVSSEMDMEGNTKPFSEERRKRKRKSRWGEVADTLNFPQNSGNLPPKAQICSAKGQTLLSQLTRSDPGLIQYAKQTFGSTDLSEEMWKKAEDHYKINLLYQDLLKKRAELNKLEKAGKFKYEYDSDEDVEGGTWEHKLRQQEMLATQLWAEELTRQAAGKHHIGDFLPPEELERFMEKYNALKEGREPDLSDYKEFKLKEDNVGYRLLQKMGWNEGQGLGQDGTGITNPVNKASTRHENQGLGVERDVGLAAGDDEYDAYRKRMMLAYRFRPNPLNNPRRPYY